MPCMTAVLPVFAVQAVKGGCYCARHHLTLRAAPAARPFRRLDIAAFILDVFKTAVAATPARRGGRHLCARFPGRGADFRPPSLPGLRPPCVAFGCAIFSRSLFARLVRPASGLVLPS